MGVSRFIFRRPKLQEIKRVERQKKEEKNFSRHKENLRRNARRRGIKRADKAKSLAY